MSGEVTPFALLKEAIDPLIDGLSEDDSFMMHPIIGDFDVDDSVEVQTPEATFTDIYGYKSNPTVYVGDRTQYISGNRDMDNGRIKMKNFTEEIRVTGDEMKRIKSRGTAGLVAKNVIKHTKRNNVTMMEEIVRSCIQGVRDGDAFYQSPLGPGDGGTIDDPYDCNATPGTALDLSALIFSGSQQTSNNVPTLMQEVWFGMKKIDAQTQLVLVPEGTPMRMGVHPWFLTRLKNTEILNDTTGQRSEKNFIELLADQGASVLDSPHFDPSYDGADGSTSVATFYCPVVRGIPMFQILLSRDPDNQTWTSWEKYRRTNGEVAFYEWVRNKAMELGFHAIPNLLYDATSGFIYYKPVFRVTLMPYDNTP